VEFVQHADFAEGMRNLYRRGGKFQKAAAAVDVLLGKISRRDRNPFAALKQTRNGETRLNNCIKYDLVGACRLVTVQKKGFCFLLYVGDHEDSDLWLNRNKGTDYKADKSGSAIEIMDEIKKEKRNEWSQVNQIQGYLFGRLQEELWISLVDGLKKVEKKSLCYIQAGDYEDLHEICDEIEDFKKAEAIRSVFLSLMSGQVEKAVNTANDYLGETLELDHVKTLIDSDKFVVLNPDNDNYLQDMKRLLKDEDYRRWMLFMHPEQVRIAASTFQGPAKLSGVSGSGKTCTVVRRAVELATRYKEEVLVVTLNRPLSNLIKDLVNVAAPEEVRNKVRVAPLFEICQEILERKEPGNVKLYDDKTWKSLEHVDEVWREFYRCELSSDSAECMTPVHDSLISRGIDAENYIRQEFDWIRSAFTIEDRSAYLSVDRKGRKYPLSKSHRESLLNGLFAWEEKMRFVGVSDYVGLASAASRYLEDITPSFRCVIVDESQDFGTTELSIVRRLCREQADDIFLCGDAAQQVSSKFQSVQRAGIKVHPSRVEKLEKNYRNSKDILEAAYTVLVDNISEDLLDNLEFELLDPKYADFNGSSPVVLEGKGLRDEISNAIQFIKDECKGKPHWKGLVAICGYSTYEIEEYAQDVGLPALTPSISIDEHQLFLSDLEQSKGFEFDVVCIVNCRRGVLPSIAIPREEQFRDLAKFYVAMTRAKSELVLSWSIEATPFLEGNKKVVSGEWSDYVDGVDFEFSEPKCLTEIRSADVEFKPYSELTGKEFLYLPEAIGMPSNTIEQVRKLITGRGVERGPRKERIEWRCIGDASGDLENHASARNRFGPESSVILRGLFKELLFR